MSSLNSNLLIKYRVISNDIFCRYYASKAISGFNKSNIERNFFLENIPTYIYIFLYQLIYY